MQLFTPSTGPSSGTKAFQLWKKLRFKMTAVWRLRRGVGNRLSLIEFSNQRDRETWESESISRYLDLVFEHSQAVPGAYDGMKTLMKSAKSNSTEPRNAPHIARVLCNYLSGFPFLMIAYKPFFPRDCDFEMDQDFDQTRLIAVMTPSEKKVHIASFGFISLHDDDPRFIRSDNKIFNLLRKALEDPAYESAVMSLEGGDARRTLDLMLKAVDDDYCWDQLIGESTILLRDAKFKRERLNRLMTKLSCDSCELPPSMYIRTTSVSPYNISAGGFADIYTGMHQNQAVALKRLRLHGSPSEFPPEIFEVFYKEVLVWRRSRHPNIIQLLGIDRITFAKEKDGTTLSMVSPWYDHGNILNCAETLEKRHRSIPFTLWLREITSGLAFLHGHDVVHGDIRSDNILIDDNLSVRIADFGLSIITNNAHTRISGVHAGSERWLPPERLTYDNPQVLSEGDIYSFACVCVELATRKPPFYGTPKNLVCQEVLGGRRPPRPTGHRRSMSDELWHLTQQCWSHSPQDRPTSSQLEQRLPTISKTIL